MFRIGLQIVKSFPIGSKEFDHSRFSTESLVTLELSEPNTSDMHQTSITTDSYTHIIEGTF